MKRKGKVKSYKTIIIDNIYAFYKNGFTLLIDLDLRAEWRSLVSTTPPDICLFK